MKKADANIWWIVIGAVIALVVLVVLLVIFTSKTGKLEGGLSGCEGKGGVCVTGDCPQNSLKSTAFDCANNQGCCLGSPKQCTAGGGCGDSADCRSTGAGGKMYCYSK